MGTDLQILRELTEISRTAGSLGPGRGRYARTPDFSAPSHPSTRPSSDRGTTFHFAHKTISKSRDVSEGNHSQTPAAAHQGYIERPSATEEADASTNSSLRQGADHPDPGDDLAPGFEFPKRDADPGRISFGTIGPTKARRKEFWNLVEASEGRRSRVQSRIIAELPAELDRQDRSLIARDFCQVFEERGLPYWATVHAPSKKNDPRNFHLHITYFDRPAGKSTEGQWDFSVTERRKRPNGSIVERRPHKRPKHPDTRKIAWPKMLRRIYADTCNFYLSLSGHAKRHDPRSYRDSGIKKEPTEHLGNKCSALEGFGLDTEPGKRNAKREIRWRFLQAEEPWISRAELLRGPELQEPDMIETRDALYDIASRGITLARQATSHQVASELLTHRVEHRSAFIDTEVARISRKDDLSAFGADAQNLVSLQSEGDMIEQRMERIRLLSRKCLKSGNKLLSQSRKLQTSFDQLARGIVQEDIFASFENDLIPIDEVDLGGGEVTDNADPFMADEDLSDITEILSGTQTREPQIHDPAQEDLSSSGPEHDDPDARQLLRGEGAEPVAGEPRPTGMRKEDPIEAIIERMLSESGDQDGSLVASDLEADDFPGAWAISRPQARSDIEFIDEKLKEFDNRSLRLGAIANRDATDICPPGELREDLNRGWQVLRFEAERRGLDLDTGIHDPGRGTDPERATLHTDQEPCPIRVIRKDLARQRVRT